MARNTSLPQDDPALDTRQAAVYLDVKASTLEVWRSSDGRGRPDLGRLDSQVFADRRRRRVRRSRQRKMTFSAEQQAMYEQARATLIALGMSPAAADAGARTKADGIEIPSAEMKHQ